jgi:hypothetical protein
VPLKRRWLQDIADEDEKFRKHFTGVRSHTGPPHLAGVAVYPAQMSVMVPHIAMNPNIPFDIAGGQLVLSNAHQTSLIQHVWSWHGNGPDDGAPVFAGKADLERIDRDAVIFHRCKDASLVNMISAGGSVAEAIAVAKPSLIQVLMRWKYGRGKFVFNRGTQKRVSLTISVPEPKLIHCLERHNQLSREAERRVQQAQATWVDLYKAGAVVPMHVWESRRSSEQMGDARRLPFLKDVLLAGLNSGGKHDFVMWTNDDTILHPGIVKHLIAVLIEKPAVSSFRINFEKGSIPPLDRPPGELLDMSHNLNPPGDEDLGRDLFAFRKDWLRDHWHTIPDFLLGELEFDLVLAYMIRKTYGLQTTKLNMGRIMPECELVKGYVLHERHNRVWTTQGQEASVAKTHNRKLATEFYADNDLHSLITNKM